MPQRFSAIGLLLKSNTAIDESSNNIYKARSVIPSQIYF